MSMIYSQNLTIAGSKKKPICIDLTFVNDAKPKPLVLFVHGFKGFKDWGHFNLVAQYFTKHHFVFAKFNFSHNGTTINNPSDFDDLEAFGNNNYIFELNDLDAVLNALISDEKFKHEININEIYLIAPPLLWPIK